MTDADWHLILPYLEENERLFGISMEHDLLTRSTVTKRTYDGVYRKVQAVKDSKCWAAMPECHCSQEYGIDWEEDRFSHESATGP